jgi:hypothetical protein
MLRRDEIMLAAARRRSADNPDEAARTIRGLMEVARPRGISPLEVEHAQALTYLDLEALYDALRSRTASKEHWEKTILSMCAWRDLLQRR